MTRKLYLGSFLRHTDIGKIYSGSFVMVQSTESEEEFDKRPAEYSFEEAEQKGVSKAILNYLFSYRLNTLKIPSGIYSEEDFKVFLRESAIKMDGGYLNMIYLLLLQSKGLHSRIIA